MPPPNVTGSLHMGHAMFVTLEVEKVVVVLVFTFSFKYFYLICAQFVGSRTMKSYVLGYMVVHFALSTSL